jgi:hypothetical protein
MEILQQNVRILFYASEENIFCLWPIGAHGFLFPAAVLPYGLAFRLIYMKKNPLRSVSGGRGQVLKKNRT